MLYPRVIPALLLSGDRLVKTRQFSRPIYVGDPINTIRIFNDKQVDELLLIDIDASRRQSAPNYTLVAEVAGECFMPLSYGGGIRSVDQADRLLSCGVEKVCVQSAALRNMRVVSEIAKRYGTQSVVLSIDVKTRWTGKVAVYNASTRETISTPLSQILIDAENAGAGEILLSNVERDGMMQGMNVALISAVCGQVTIPVIASSGAGSLADIKAALDAGASAVAAGAFFVFHGPHQAVLITYPDKAQLQGLLDAKS